ncbi:hypothetical protein [uncultured Chryseobacterium sp.]|uniref:hypothetical protein n=1 Tax=uncultured Chryseobacterium sp. TaxID=259322 RepID=UPI0025832341|nr:hypothetical protein [uncultured Chryseobacterium sp.]
MIRQIFTYCLPILLFFNIQKDRGDLEFVRSNYNKAMVDKDLCALMIKDLQQADENIAFAYLGGLETVWAKHALNPILKLKAFNKGKRKIEQAVQKEPENIEIRFIRLSVQKHAPSFLGYNDNMKEDISFIQTKRQEIKSQILLNNVDKLLKYSK